ncbi:hypothetical protein [Thermoflavimicrobium daqui]|uniref:Uncharacterized protein n=1 Tax=Thermoflavimicrobium daqui TaxID=2137476 RepID=A0A364K5M4_9BACL|nr:hypothetical protein [Thermoflavimicrobium daqui]RAL25568.1 hypothetical protein DL897_05625 [Thermoflavimicrobium daqui]
MSMNQPEHQPDKSKNKYAVISLVLAIIFLFSGIFIIFIADQISPILLLAFIVVAVVFGLIGMKSEKRRLAKVGVVVSAIVFFFLSVLLLLTMGI